MFYCSASIDNIMFKNSVYTLLVFNLSLLFLATYGQFLEVPELPPIACPNYFQYISNGGTYFGKITLPHIQMGSTQVNVELSQRFPVESNNYGSLSLDQDEGTTINKLQNGLPVSYRVEFPRTNVVPKLTQIAVNGMVICSASEYPAPSVSLKLQHTFTFTLPSLQQTAQSLYPNDGPAVYYIQQEEPFVYRTKSTVPQLTPLKPKPLKVSHRTQPQQLQQPQQPEQPQQSQPQEVTFTTRTQLPTQEQPLPQQLSQAQQKNSEAAAACGREGAASNNFIPYIYGGRPLRRGEYPWLTAIYRKHTTGVNFICGGSLISSSLVLSAAHCFEFLTSDKISVTLGRYNLSDSMENVVSRDISSLIVHPEYKPGGKRFPDADLALLRMFALVSFTDLISPICLWTEPADETLIVGQSAMVAGWGTDESNNISPVPKKAEADVVSERVCLNSSLAFYSISSDRTLCAGKRDGTGPCVGDSGGALMMLRNNRWVLRGVVSAGQTEQMRCNLLEYVLYCDVAKHITWVQGYLQPS